MRTLLLLVASFLSLASLGLRAADVTLINDQNGISDDWNTAADWSNGLAPSSDNSYSTGSLTLRAGTSSFTGAGGSLLINGGTLLVPVGGANVFVRTISLDNGTLETAASLTDTTGVFLYLSGSNTFLAATGSTLNMAEGLISGSGSVFFGDNTGTNSGTYIVATSNAVSFNGTINAVSGNFTFEFGSNFPAASFVFSSGVQSVTDTAPTVASLTVDGISFGPGTYTSAELNEAIGRTLFQNSTFTVEETPEPTVTALLGFSLGGLLLLVHRRPRLT